jgi:GT2 family glycosyltransferase
MKNIANPLVSVVIHSFDRFEYLLNAIESIENQTYRNFEIILINDESNQKQYYEHIFPKFVKKIDINRSELPRWTGSRQSLINIGVANSKGDYIALLDDDDYWLPKKLEVQIKEMIENNYKFSSTEGYFGEGIYDPSTEYKLYNSEHFFSILKRKYRKTNYIKSGKFPKNWNYDFLSIHNCVIKSSVIIEKELFNTLGGFRGLPEYADYDCWLGLLKITDLLYVDEPLFYYDGSHAGGKKYI